MIENDEQLAAAVELLKDPARIRQTLQAADEARRKRPDTHPADLGIPILQ